MTPQLLREIGEALFGPQWQSAMARLLDVAVRTVQRWAAGATEIPDGILPPLLAALRDRPTEIAAEIEALRRMPPKIEALIERIEDLQLRSAAD